MMQHAARAHWRAAAWLLERTDPGQYAKRPKDSASPNQFNAGLEFVMEAALAAIPPELHEQVYEYMAAAAEEAFACLFPNFGRWGDAKRPKLPPTPLVQQQCRHRCTDPKFTRVVAEHEHGNITETVPPQLPAHLLPRASRIKPAMASPPSATHARARSTPYDPSRRRANVSRYNHRHLSPKTRFTTERTPNDAPPNNAPVSREAGAVFDPEAQTRRERVPVPTTAVTHESLP
jgi:hypothetical protein